MKILAACLVLLSSISNAQETRSFTNGNIELFYQVAGRGTPLYVLTGGPGHPPEVPGLQLMDSLKNNFTIVLLHQRGSGLSKNIICDSQTINIAAYVSDVEKLMQVRGDKKAILLGYSWGGLLAQAFAAKNPDRVSKLVLVSSAPPSYKVWDVLFDNQFSRTSTAEKDSMNMLRKVFSTKTGAELEALKKTDPSSKELQAFYAYVRILHRGHFYDRARIDPDFDQIMKDFNFQPIPFIDKEVMETKWDITAQLKKLNIPALIIYGRQDDQGESTFYLQKESLKNSTMIAVEKCGHMIWEEQPEILFRHLKHFLIASSSR